MFGHSCGGTLGCIWWRWWLYCRVVSLLCSEGLSTKSCTNFDVSCILCHRFLSEYPSKIILPPPQSSFCFKYVSENFNASHISKWGDPLGDHLFEVMADSVVFPMAEIPVFVFTKETHFTSLLIIGEAVARKRNHHHTTPHVIYYYLRQQK